MKTLIMGSEEGSSIIIITTSSSIISIKNSLNSISLAPVEVIILLHTALTVTLTIFASSSRAMYLEAKIESGDFENRDP